MNSNKEAPYMSPADISASYARLSEQNAFLATKGLDIWAFAALPVSEREQINAEWQALKA